MRFLLPLILLVGPVAAHPHTKVEQQAMLSIGLDRASLSIRIVPSYDEGAAILAYIDKNEDGVISQAEETLFGQAVLSQTRLTVDRSEVALSGLSVAIPDAAEIASGSGIIEINAEARYQKLTGQAHSIALTVSYEDLSHDWFVQPFFYKDLHNSYPEMEVSRSNDRLHTEIILSS